MSESDFGTRPIDDGGEITSGGDWGPFPPEPPEPPLFPPPDPQPFPPMRLPEPDDGEGNPRPVDPPGDIGHTR